MYVCERPTWGNDEGCGPNKTRYTYAFFVDSDDFASVKVSAEANSRYKGWEYVFAETRGCDLSRASGEQGKYWLTDKGFIFGLGMSGREVELQTTSMNAKILGPSVKNSPYMTCEEVKGETLRAHPELGGVWPRVVRPTPLDPAPTDHSDR